MTQGEASIEGALDDLFNADDPMAIVLHASSGDRLACGELSGFVRDGMVAVGIRPLDDSGFYGVAVFHEDADVTGQTTVTTYLFEEKGAAGPTGLGDASTPISEVIADGIATALPNADEPLPDADEATPEP